MTDDNLMNDNSRVVRPAEPGYSFSLTSLKDARPHYVHISFTPRADLPPEVKESLGPTPKSWRSLHVSGSAAKEFARSLAHDPKAVGSPKQYKARRARRLRIPLDLLDLYDYEVTIKEITHDATPSKRSPVRVPGAFGRSNFRPEPGPDTIAAPGGGSIHSRPSLINREGLDVLSVVLSDDETSIFLSRDEAGQDSGQPESDLE